MSKHTPGPWAEDHRANVASVSIRGANKFAVCACKYKGPDGRTTGDSIAEGKANARLIAAAPDLLAMLQEIATCLQERDIEPGLVKQARAAIAKAEGAS